ncbi:MAG: BMP family ABC transporter substrate-binding protein [Chloroflexi bacterium]|nr:BMP family ABC transporter substrate-binding protein [Chloroflexota bacterium]
MSLKRFALFMITAMLVVVAASCAPPPAAEPVVEEAGVPSVFAAFATAIEEPWDGVIHEALLKAESDGRITYEYTDDIGYAGDMERVLREVAEESKPDIIFGDAFGNEEAVRRVAADYPEIAFAFGSGFGPSGDNFSVFDNWIHEPAYLCGLIAGGVSESGVIGVVGGHPVPEVNRIVNAFIQGVKEVNPEATVLVTFINSWFDPAAAKEAALSQIDASADVLFAERFGVIEAAVENGLFAFGNMSDQNELGPENVLTGPVWNMQPTVDYVIEQVIAGSFTSQDLKDFSMMGKGGASLADYHGLESKIPAEILDLVAQRNQEILDGLFRVDIDEAAPAGSN